MKVRLFLSTGKEIELTEEEYEELTTKKYKMNEVKTIPTPYFPWLDVKLTTPIVYVAWEVGYNPIPYCRTDYVSAKEVEQ